MTTPDPDHKSYGDQAEPPPYPRQPNGAEPTVPPRPSSPQPGWSEPAYPQSAYPQSGYPQSGYPQSGYPPPDYAQPGYGQVPPYPDGTHSGYGVPGYATGGYGAPGYAGPGWIVPDPLVPHPGGGFNAWWTQIWRALGRSWRPLALIGVVTSVLPGAAFAVIYAFFEGSMVSTVDRLDGGQDVIIHWDSAGPFLAVTAVFLLVSVFASGAGWAASMWVVTRQAAGAPVAIGAALAYGGRRVLRIGGVLIVVGLMVLVGLVCCVVPGLYLATASCLVVPFLLFDRGTSAIGGSFRLVNRNFGAVLGRLLVAYLLLSAVSAAVSGIIKLAAGGGSTAGDLVGNVLAEVIVSVPITMFAIIAILLIYAQMRARSIPTTVHDLVRALDS